MTTGGLGSTPICILEGHHDKIQNVFILFMVGRVEHMQNGRGGPVLPSASPAGNQPARNLEAPGLLPASSQRSLKQIPDILSLQPQMFLNVCL